MYFKNMNRGFTLAEVLITLGIIGVIAAIVIPALNNKIQDMQTKSALQKVQSTLSAATQRIVQENGGSLWSPNTSTEMINQYKKYLQYSKTGTMADVWAYSLKFKYNASTILDLTSASTNDWGIRANRPSLILNDGTLLAFASDGDAIPVPTAYGRPGHNPNLKGYIWVDINGAKPPNTAAIDVFAFQVRAVDSTNQAFKLVPAGTGGDAVDGDALVCGYNYTFDHWGCTAKMLGF